MYASSQQTPRTHSRRGVPPPPLLFAFSQVTNQRDVYSTLSELCASCVQLDFRRRGACVCVFFAQCASARRIESESSLPIPEQSTGAACSGDRGLQLRGSAPLGERNNGGFMTARPLVTARLITCRTVRRLQVVLPQLFKKKYLCIFFFSHRVRACASFSDRNKHPSRAFRTPRGGRWVPRHTGAVNRVNRARTRELPD